MSIQRYEWFYAKDAAGEVRIGHWANDNGDWVSYSEHVHEFRALLAAKDEEIVRLKEAIKWALGESGNFPLREPGEGAYWWRTQLRERAFKESPHA